MTRLSQTAVSLLASATTSLALISKDGVSGRLPTLGWNSWNAYRCDINEEKFTTAAKYLKDLGLADAGYTYVNLDDCWSMKDGRDPETGRLMPNMTRFPAGIDGLAAEIHSMDLKIGIYSDAGSETCAGYPGSLYHEQIDAETWAEWDIDYLKYDNCNVPDSWPSDEYHSCHPDFNHPAGPNGTCVDDPGQAPPGYDWAKSSTAIRYGRMQGALEKQEQTILYSLCEWGQANVQEWGNQTSMSWRMTDDIFPNFDRIKHIINYNQFHMNYVNFWGHNDADMLEVGNGDLTEPETRTHFALWAIMKSPLLIGTDLGTLSDHNLDVLKNEHLLRFSQDPIVGEAAAPYKWGQVPDWTYSDQYPAEYWSGDYGDGKKIVVITNYQDDNVNKTADWKEIPGLEEGKSYKVVNGWTNSDEGCQKDGWTFDLESNDSGVFVIGEECEE